MAGAVVVDEPKPVLPKAELVDDPNALLVPGAEGWPNALGVLDAAAPKGFAAPAAAPKALGAPNAELLPKALPPLPPKADGLLAALPNALLDVACPNADGAPGAAGCGFLDWLRAKLTAWSMLLRTLLKAAWVFCMSDSSG